MASLGKLVGLSDDEYADLEERVDRFYNSWAADGSTDLEPFLPPVGVRHRPVVLVEMIKTDMGRRARAGLSIRVEPYLARFRSDIPPDATPVSLLVEEFRLRQQYADRPAVDEYRSRFPTVAEAFARQLTDTPADEQQPPRSATIGLGTHDTSRDARIVPEKTRKTDVLPPPARKKPATSSPDPTEVLPADLQYKLLGKLGKGTFGEVFEAIAPGGFPVAVKRILRAVDHPASQGEIEALDAMKTLAHPFLLQTHAYWVFRDRLVIVMELADGSLAGRIEHHKAEGRAGVPPTELIPLFEQAAEALDYLHSQNVSHRDLKPENLLLLKGYMKVADFGLARVHEHQMTVVVAEVGTPCYMAPEVWQRKVSLHSDQYSLAATYVSSRLGRPPFQGQTLHELCLQHLQEAPNLEGLPPDERRVLMKALAKSPTDRYPNCKAFVSALRAVVLPAARPKQRWAVWVALTAAAMALAVGLAVGVMWKLRPDTPPSGTGPGPDPQPVSNKFAPMWAIPSDAATETLPGGLVVSTRLTRVVGGETLELVLILPKPDQPDDPPAFYMLRNKVTNRVCRAMWQELEAGANSRLKRFRRLLAPQMEKLLLPGVWRQGAVGLNGQPLGSTGEQEGWPVVGVTMPEARLVAEELGGRLPTLKQWRKAVGANGEDPRPGPAGESDGFARALAGTTGGFGVVFASRPMALGVLAPWPVDTPTADRSIYGIHQLTSNGFEWAEADDGPERIDPFTRPGEEHRLPKIGETWETLTLPTFKRIATQQRGLSVWTDTDELIGFRIVATPK